MHPGLLRDGLTLAAGALSGCLSGAFGVGGAVVSTPAIRALGVSAGLAVGTTLPSILPSAASGTARYWREGLIDWRVVAWTVPPGALAAVGGSLLSSVVPGHGHWLMVLTGLLLGATALRMARRPTGGEDQGGEDGKEAGRGRRDRPAVLAAVGVGAGCLSGLLGVGGGTVLIPGFSVGARIPLKETIATSLVCVGLFAIPGTFTHALLGDLDWRYALLLTVGVVPGARLGAVVAVRSGERRLRLAVAFFLGLLAAVYVTGELLAVL